MPVHLVISDHPDNQSVHTDEVRVNDPIEAFVRFDRPVVHELQYVDQDVTRFWLELALDGRVVSRIPANKVLDELMDEARLHRPGRFRFSVCRLPDQATRHFHAAFADALAGRAPGRHEVTARFVTDNKLQAGDRARDGRHDVDDRLMLTRYLALPRAFPHDRRAASAHRPRRARPAAWAIAA